MLSFAKTLVALLILSGLMGQMAAQALPVSAAPMAMSSSDCARMMASAKQLEHKTPCDRECLTKMGCGVVAVADVRDTQTPVSLRYVAVVFYQVSRHLAGLQVEPEIFPPIALI